MSQENNDHICLNVAASIGLRHRPLRWRFLTHSFKLIPAQQPTSDWKTTKNMPSTVPLAEYLFTRLRQLGVESIHGVPGDYNLALLDYVVPQGIHWVGNCNELNAGYAADAYSRVKGLGALITTFGVGELSAANAIAGAYCELAPVVHIVGTPARHLQESRALIHQ